MAEAVQLRREQAADRQPAVSSQIFQHHDWWERRIIAHCCGSRAGLETRGWNSAVNVLHVSLDAASFKAFSAGCCLPLTSVVTQPVNQNILKVQYVRWFYSMYAGCPMLTDANQTMDVPVLPFQIAWPQHHFQHLLLLSSSQGHFNDPSPSEITTVALCSYTLSFRAPVVKRAHYWRRQSRTVLPESV